MERGRLPRPRPALARALLDPAAQLKPDDLRRSLFDWADGVMSGTIGAAEPFDLPDPEFTGQVLRALRKRGYRVEAGHDAGAWRLDMVVRARGRAAAIECDGSGREDEDAIRRDMERQTVLERAGWKFVRVRSADWFRRPEKTLERVCEALAALGIAPEPEDCAPQKDLLLAHVRANVERLEAGLDMIVFDKEDEDPVPPVAPVTPADLAPDDAEPVVTTPVQFEAPLMPVEVEKADIMLIPEMEMRDAVRISLPTLSDVFDDEPATEADAKTEDEAPNEPAAESCGDPHHTPVTFMEVIRDGLMDRGINPVLHTTPNDATMTIGGRTPCEPPSGAAAQTCSCPPSTTSSLARARAAASCTTAPGACGRSPKPTSRSASCRTSSSSSPERPKPSDEGPVNNLSCPAARRRTPLPRADLHRTPPSTHGRRRNRERRGPRDAVKSPFLNKRIKTSVFCR
ncbi:MAG: hypothetical protein ACLUNV_09200 [Sutterella wadsworthensis]